MVGKFEVAGCLCTITANLQGLQQVGPGIPFAQPLYLVKELNFNTTKSKFQNDLSTTTADW